MEGNRCKWVVPRQLMFQLFNMIGDEIRSGTLTIASLATEPEPP